MLQFFSIFTLVEPNRAGCDNPRQRCDGMTAGRGHHAEIADIRARQYFCRRKSARTDSVHENLRNISRAGDTHLLTENRPHRRFKAVPCTWNPKTRGSIHIGPQPRIFTQLSIDGGTVRIEVEDATQATHDAMHRLRYLVGNTHHQGIGLEFGLDPGTIRFQART